MNNSDAIYRLMHAPLCPLAPGLRQFVIALAYLADWRTGRGIAGQGRIAEAMGCDVRTVRRYKQQLAEAAGSPVSVKWRHRSRPDGLNGSDAYSISITDTGQAVLDTGQKPPRHRTPRPTKITSEFPLGNTSDQENENELISGKGPSAPRLSEPSGMHCRNAQKAGLVAADELAAWRAHHIRQGTTFQNLTHEARSFGGWLKFVAPLKRAKKADEDEGWIPWVEPETGEMPL